MSTAKRYNLAYNYIFEQQATWKKELIIKTKINKFSVKEINANTYRLSVGPFKNFSALKSIYISLSNLGFEDLNVYKE